MTNSNIHFIWRICLSLLLSFSGNWTIVFLELTYILCLQVKTFLIFQILWKHGSLITKFLYFFCYSDVLRIFSLLHPWKNLRQNLKKQHKIYKNICTTSYLQTIWWQNNKASLERTPCKEGSAVYFSHRPAGMMAVLLWWRLGLPLEKGVRSWQTLLRPGRLCLRLALNRITTMNLLNINVSW